jgi:hypothetical protein
MIPHCASGVCHRQLFHHGADLGSHILHAGIDPTIWLVTDRLESRVCDSVRGRLGYVFVGSDDTRTILFSGSSAVAAMLLPCFKKTVENIDSPPIFRLLLSPSALPVAAAAAAVAMYFNSRASDRAGDRFVYATLVTLGSALFFLLLAVRCALPLPRHYYCQCHYHCVPDGEALEAKIDCFCAFCRPQIISNLWGRTSFRDFRI